MTIAVDNLSFAYPNGPKIFSGITFEVEKGEIFAILGCNGTGKSTLLSCIVNQLKPGSGTTSLDGRNIAKIPIEEFARKVGYVPQFHQPVFPYTVEELVVMGRAPHLGAFGSPKKEDFKIAHQMMEIMQISHLSGKSYLQISGGERQLALITQALTQQPDYLILDEPTAHLDFGNQIRMLKILKKLASQGYGIIFTTHFPDHLLMFSLTVGIMHQGKLLAIGPAERVITPEIMETIYNLEVDISFHPQLNRPVCLAK